MGVVADEGGDGGEVPQGRVGALPVGPEQPLGQFRFSRARSTRSPRNRSSW